MLRTHAVTKKMYAVCAYEGHSYMTFKCLWTVTKTSLFGLDFLTRSGVYKQILVTRSRTADETVA